MDANPRNSIIERFDALAASDPNEFRPFFRRLYNTFPEQAAEACLWYIASRGMDRPAQTMACWLGLDATYIRVLLDPDSLPLETALKATAVVRNMDLQFFAKFAKAAGELTSPAVILRALGLLQALGDYSALMSWLRSLSQNPDVRVRSRAAKLLCDLRPTKGLIDRQLQSSDARVRAGAVEGLEKAKNYLPLEEIHAMLVGASRDQNHRVVANALVGLYRIGDTSAIHSIIELCGHKMHLFRAAMAWAAGVLQDPRAIPAMRDLTRDVSLVVRKRALSSLLILESLAVPETAPEKTESESELPVEEQGTVQEPANADVVPSVPEERTEEEPEVPAPLEEGPRMFLFK